MHRQPTSVSYRYITAVQDYLSEAHLEKGLDAVIRECHPRQALELLDGGYAEIAVIRYCVEYRDHFSEQAALKELSLLPLNQEKYQITVSAESPMAQNTHLRKNDLSGWIELVHQDTFFPHSKGESLCKRIYTVDRMAQLQLMHAIPHTYLWAEPLPSLMLAQHRLVQIPCLNNETLYQIAIACKPQCAMSDMERGFLRYLSESRQ